MYTESNGLGSDPKPFYFMSLKRIAELDAEIEADWQRYWAEQAALRVKHVARPMVRAPPVVNHVPAVKKLVPAPKAKPAPVQPKQPAKYDIAADLAAVDVPELVIELAELQQ